MASLVSGVLSNMIRVDSRAASQSFLSILVGMEGCKVSEVEVQGWGRRRPNLRSKRGLGLVYSALSVDD